MADWTWVTAALGAVGAVAGWLQRRRLGRAWDWLDRRIRTEAALYRCNRDRTADAESFASQVAAKDRQIAAMASEREFLAAALREITEAAGLTKQAADRGLLTILPPSPSAPSPSPESSRPSRSKRGRDPLRVPSASRDGTE